MASVRLDPSPTQRRVLTMLKRSDEATADELAEALGITSSAVRQHLSALRAAELVDSRKDRGQPGRPADRFFVTPQAESLFSASDDDLSLALLEHIEEEDPELVDRVFDRRRRKLVDAAEERLAGIESVERIEALARLLDEQGYLADAEQVEDDHYRIKLHNCAMWSVANRFCQACSSELDFVRDMLPGTSVERVSHKTAGAHACAYDVRLDTDS
jgi:predicted ArsR family transcriptional regulator